MTTAAAGCGRQRRPHQVRALTNLTGAFAEQDRAQLHWACGTGKTLVGRWLAEDLGAGTTLVLVPSLALVAQALAEWQTASDWPFTAIVVCSDRTTGDAWRIDAGWWTRHGVEVTTDTRPVVRFLTGGRDLPRVVFSTYHSAPVVAAAARRARACFGLVVADEAHRLAGEPDERFAVVLDDVQLPARRRMFATATPIYARPPGLSMADIKVFGPVADRLDFADAIGAGLLVDYQVLVLDEVGDAGKLVGGATVPAALAAAAGEGLRRVLTFHSRVAAARRFAAATDNLRLADGRRVRARAVAGADPTARRRAVLADLATSGPQELAVVANARCLTEGIDVPSVDGVVFADPKTSDTDIVQAIGRALRPAPGKARGLIILPVVVPPGGAEQLFGGPFATVWGVLRTLRSLDPRMAAELDRHRRWRPSQARAAAGGRRPSRLLRFDLDGIDVATLAARVLDDTEGEHAWESMLGLLRGWSRQHGHTAVPTSTTAEGRWLGRWVAAQRRAYAAEALGADRVARLEGIPGWAWTHEGAWWRLDHATVADIATRCGGLDLDDQDVCDRPLPHRTGKHRTTVGRWCAQQRRACRDGDLAGWQVDACEQIPSWTWNAGVAERDLRMVDALAEWVDRHRNANVPHEARWGQVPLGKFITTIRRRAVTGRLTRPLAADVAVVTPATPAAGALQWQPDQTRWELHYLAVWQFAARTGGCDIPEHGTEQLHGHPWQIYTWATRQRHQYRYGRLDPQQAVLLEQIPGWTWERPCKQRVLVGIGARQHGTRLGYAAGCRCEPCTAANTAYEADRQRRSAAGQATTDLVDAATVRGHLRILQGQVGNRARASMQALTGLNPKTIAEVINGARGRVHPEVAQALRSLTVDRLREHIAAHPSPRDPVPAGPVLALVDQLVDAGWPKAWIARELGAATPALQIAKTSNGLVRRETAEAIQVLHTAIGKRRPPPRRQREPLPQLAEILTAARAEEVNTCPSTTYG